MLFMANNNKRSEMLVQMKYSVFKNVGSVVKYCTYRKALLIFLCSEMVLKALQAHPGLLI
jgi:hypothetical protein